MAVGSRTNTRIKHFAITAGRITYQENRQKQEASNIDGVYQGHKLKYDPGNHATGGNIRGRWKVEISLLDGWDTQQPIMQKIETAMDSTASRMLAQGLKQIRKGKLVKIEVFPATNSKQSSVCTWFSYVAPVREGEEGAWVKFPESEMPKIPGDASPELRQRMTDENNVLAREWITKHLDYESEETAEDSSNVVDESTGAVVPVSQYPVVHGFIFPDDKWPNPDSFKKPLREFDKVAIPFRDLLDEKVQPGVQRSVVGYLLDAYGHGRDIAAVADLTLGEAILVGIFLRRASDSVVMEITSRAARSQAVRAPDQYGAEKSDEDITFD